jgi:hypothetical protein
MKMLETWEGGLKYDQDEVFYFYFLLIIYFLTIISNRFQTLNFTYVEQCVRNNKGIKGLVEKIFL